MKKLKVHPGLHWLLLCITLHPLVTDEDVRTIARWIRDDNELTMLLCIPILLKKYDIGPRHLSRFSTPPGVHLNLSFDANQNKKAYIRFSGVSRS